MAEQSSHHNDLAVIGISERRGVALGEVALPPTHSNRDSAKSTEDSDTVAPQPSPRLCSVLDSLGLSQYLETLADQGILSWQSLLDLSENEIELLNFGHGDHQKLKLEIGITKKIRNLQRELDLAGNTLATKLPPRRKDSKILPKRKRKNGQKDELNGLRDKRHSSMLLDTSCPPEAQSGIQSTHRKDSKDVEAVFEDSHLQWDSDFLIFDPISFAPIDSLLEWDVVPSMFDQGEMAFTQLDNQTLASPNSEPAGVGTLHHNQSTGIPFVFSNAGLQPSFPMPFQKLGARSKESQCSDSPCNLHQECMYLTEMEAAIETTGKSLRYAVTLIAPTAIIKSADDTPVTYLNRGQTYFVHIVDTAPPVSGAKYRTSIGLSFEHIQTRQDKSDCWSNWRRIQGAQSKAVGFRAVEFVNPTTAGFKSSSSSSSPSFELVATSFDGFAVEWAPTTNTQPDFLLALRFNFLCTDLTLAKEASDLAIRLCVKTEVVRSPPHTSAASTNAEICYCMIQLLTENGAERKQSDDLVRVTKKMDDASRRIQQSSSRESSQGSDSTYGSDTSHRTKWKSGTRHLTSANLRRRQTGAEENLLLKLQSLKLESKSSKPATSLSLRGENLDDPDLRPFLSEDQRNGPTSRGAMSTPSKVDSSIHVGPQLISNNSKSMRLQNDTYRPDFQAFICVFVQPTFIPSAIGAPLYRALYLKSRTRKHFLELLASKCGITLSQITRVTRVNKQGLQMPFDDEMVRNLEVDQDMIAEFEEIQFPPSLYISPSDLQLQSGASAEYESANSNSFELKLLY